MSGQLPPSLKPADIGRFALRAGQLENAKPVIAYWCNYWIVQQILQKGLHSVDQDALTYTTNLMDKLEKFKNEHSTDESVTDDMAGKAVVEQFAQETFNRADNAMRANKATRQTADTYQAAATFFELMEIWGPLEPEVHKKIKFGKFHALRIAKALKNGEDPNLSNPQPEPTAEEMAPALDPNDPEVLALNGDGPKPRQASVVDAPDETDSIQAGLARQSSLNESIHPSRAPSAPPPNERNASVAVSPIPKDADTFYSNQQNEVSPISPERKLSTGGNYFPRMPSPAPDRSQAPTLPSAPNTFAPGLLDLPSAPPGDAANASAPNLPPPPTTFAAPTIGQAPVNALPPSLPQAPHPQQHLPSRQAPQQAPSNPYAPPMPTPSHPVAHTSFAPPPAASSQPAYVPASLATANTNVVVDEEAMLKAQKHARWAISALNFEDVPTAIREFQAALQTLGAR